MSLTRKIRETALVIEDTIRLNEGRKGLPDGTVRVRGGYEWVKKGKKWDYVGKAGDHAAIQDKVAKAGTEPYKGKIKKFENQHGDTVMQASYDNDKTGQAIGAFAVVKKTAEGKFEADLSSGEYVLGGRETIADEEKATFDSKEEAEDAASKYINKILTREKSKDHPDKAKAEFGALPVLKIGNRWEHDPNE